MDDELSPHTSNSLVDKVIHADIHSHADIRIQSIEDVNDESTQSSRLTEQHSQNPEDVAQQEKAAEMQVWWDEAIAKHMGYQDGYTRVAVLLIKWDDGLDELKTRAETEELRAVFEDQFHYHCSLVEINVSSKPQHQLNRYISTFVEQNDGPNNLLIVYYTGHGVYREDAKYLELTASINPTGPRGLQNDARANWETAEALLRSHDVEGDVLTILDTCYSSNLQKSGKEDTRTFELLSACALDTTTASPGPNSFTRALIDALKELLHDPETSFTTFHLNQKICLNPNRRDTPSQLWGRLKHHGRHIRLAPLKPEKDGLQRKPSFFKPPQGYLTLRFALRDDSLTRAQIEFLSRNLATAFSNKSLLGLRKIDWLGLKPARTTHFGRTALAMFAIAQWRRVVQRRRKEQARRKPVDDVVLVANASATRKRGREDDEALPEPKKGLLGMDSGRENPPSPPVSVDSRVESVDHWDLGFDSVDGGDIRL